MSFFKIARIALMIVSKAFDLHDSGKDAELIDAIESIAQKIDEVHDEITKHHEKLKKDGS